MVTRDDVKQHMAGFLKRPAERLDDQSVLTDLVTDSFVLVDMVIDLQEELGTRLMQDDLKEVKTVGDLTKLFVAHAQ